MHSGDVPKDLKDPKETPQEAITKILDSWWPGDSMSQQKKASLARFIVQELTSMGYVIKTEWQDARDCF